MPRHVRRQLRAGEPRWRSISPTSPCTTSADGTPVGNLDGIEPLSDTSFLVTDWVAGALFVIDAKGNVKQLLDLNQGSADIGWLPNEHLLLIPMMKDDKLVAYRVK